MGCSSGEIRVAHRSAKVRSTSLIPGSVGGAASIAEPGSVWSLSVYPAFHNAWRRDSPKQSNAPAVASASVCGTVRPVRRTTSFMLVKGCRSRSATIRSASSRPIPCTSISPSRTAKLPSRRCSSVRSGAVRTNGGVAG